MIKTMPRGAPVDGSAFGSNAVIGACEEKCRLTCGYGVSGERPVMSIDCGGGGPTENSSY